MRVPGIQALVRAASARHLRALADLRSVAGVLGPCGVPYLVVKGPSLVEACYWANDLRSYVDLDVLIRPADLPRVAGYLQDGGFELVERNWPMLTAAGVKELRFVSPQRGVLDLHWSLGSSGMRDHTPAAERLLDRSSPITIAGTPTRTLGWSDMVTHLAVHAARSGGNRLIWAADLRAAVERGVALGELGSLGAAIREWNAEAAVRLMARRTERVLGWSVPVPGSLRYGPGVWGGVVAIGEVVSPYEQYQSGGSLSRLIAGASRGGTNESLRELLRRGRAAAIGRRGPLGVDELNDSTNPMSALFPKGGNDAAEEFFVEVARDGPREA